MITKNSYISYSPVEQHLRACETQLVAEIGNAISATFFTEKLEQVPLLLKSLFESVQANGRAKAEMFYDPLKAVSLESAGIRIKIHSQIPGSNKRFVLAEVKIFSDESEKKDSRNNTGFTKWFGTAKRIESLLYTKDLTEDEPLPWTNTATTMAELFEDANKLTPVFQNMCNEAASTVNCTVGFTGVEKELVARKEHLKTISHIQPEKTSTSKSTILKIIGGAVAVFSAFICIKNNDFQIIQARILQNTLQGAPCNCICANESNSYNETHHVTIVNTGGSIPQAAPINSACHIEVTVENVEIQGPCTLQQKNAAYEQRDQLRAAEKNAMKEANHKRNQAIDTEKKKEIATAKQNREASAKDWEERMRKINNPTPQELAELYAEIDCKLDKRFRGWPGYVSTCPTSTSTILEDDCGVLKSQFNKLALLFHPDKNPSPEAKNKFAAAQKAYETLCPRKPQEFRDHEVEEEVGMKDS